MYNLFVTAQEHAWEKPFYEYDRSRFLEYTNDEIASSFEPLNSARIDKLKSLPCLFAYEGTKANVRLGWLKEISERGRLLLIEYGFFPGIDEIPFSAIAEIAPLLDIREWEMNRTHWAVKDEDLIGRLYAAALIDRDSVELPEPVSPKVAPRRISRGSNVTTVRGFIEKVFSEKREMGEENFYRGHSDKRGYKLEPALFRRDDEGNYLYLDNEHILYRELIVANPSEFSSDQYTFDRLVRMQHYSLPTRLLDITSNPLIGLYFACRSNLGTDENGSDEKEGEVIAFTLRRSQLKYYDSDTASCIANLARLPKLEKAKISFDLDIEEFNTQIAVKRLIHHIREEKSFFERRIEPEDLRRVICVKARKSNDRILNQSGAFLLFGHDAVLDETGTPEIRVTRIAVSNKRSILNELDRLNINESTVFPNIESSARYVARKYRFLM